MITCHRFAADAALPFLVGTVASRGSTTAIRVVAATRLENRMRSGATSVGQPVVLLSDKAPREEAGIGIRLL